MAARDPMLLQLGKYLRKHREERGWSQEEFACECGLHRTYIGAVERGEYNLTLLSLRNITDTLGDQPAGSVGSRRRPAASKEMTVRQDL